MIWGVIVHKISHTTKKHIGTHFNATKKRNEMKKTKTNELSVHVCDADKTGFVWVIQDSVTCKVDLFLKKRLLSKRAILNIDRRRKRKPCAPRTIHEIQFYDAKCVKHSRKLRVKKWCWVQWKLENTHTRKCRDNLLNFMVLAELWIATCRSEKPSHRTIMISKQCVRRESAVIYACTYLIRFTFIINRERISWTLNQHQK